MRAASRSLLAWLVLAPWAGAADVRPVTLGLVAPPSEPAAASLVRGARLAVADAGGPGSAPVALEVRGGEGQWGTVGNDAVVLVCTRHVDALIAPSDGAASHLILQVAGRTRVPVATLCADSSVTEAGVPWAVRVVARNDQEAEALFAAARPAGGPAPRWFAVIPADRPGRVVRRDLEAAARRSATPLARILEDGPKPDAAARARAIAAEAPDGVLLWLAPARAGAVAAALRAAGYRGYLAGPGPLDSPAFVAAAGAAADGVLVADYRAGADGRVAAERFAAEYRRRFGVEPDASAAAAYDAARVLIETLRRAGKDAAYQLFPPGQPVAGVTGEIGFDASGNRTGAPQVLISREGRFVPNPPTESQP